MTNEQRLTLVFALLLVVALFFGFDIKSPQVGQITSNSDAASTVSRVGVEKRAFDNLNAEQKSTLKSKEILLNQSSDSLQKLTLLEDLARLWFSFQQPAMSGLYAKRIAEIKQDALSWAITGSTFFDGISKYSNQLDKQFCTENAIFALENAISLDPADENHRLNLALVHVANPSKENPMQGILMLRDQLDKNPENVNVLYHLARLSVQTGQYENAKKRLLQLLEIEPEHAKGNCLIGKIAENVGLSENIENYLKYCN